MISLLFHLLRLPDYGRNFASYIGTVVFSVQNHLRLIPYAEIQGLLE